MYFFGRGISAFFNQFFKWLFWNKTGQKLLFSVLIVFIFFCFIKLGEVSAVEEVQDINYEVRSYYDGVVSNGILFIENNWDNFSESFKTNLLNTQFVPYFYYGSTDGSSCNNAKPTSNNYINVAVLPRTFNINDLSISSYDYISVTGYTMYSRNNTTTYRLNLNSIQSSNVDLFFPLFIRTYTPVIWSDYILAKNNNDVETITALLEDINESLSNTTPTSETDSFVDIDSSSVDDVSSASIDNIFSNMTTSFSNKFTNYDLDTVYSFVWNLNGTRITFYSDTLYKMIRGTFFETLLSMLWYYIFGHYAFVWLSNIIHKIKDGSILDGLEVNEVITKEML